MYRLWWGGRTNDVAYQPMPLDLISNNLTLDLMWIDL